MTQAQIPDSHLDLLDAKVAVLATVGPDGRPQQSVVWFQATDGVLRVSLNTTRQKTRNLLRHPVIDLLIVDPTDTGRYLEVRGDAEVAPDGDYAFADQVGAKYGGVDLRQMDRPGESRVVVTVRPVRVNAIDLSAR